MGPLYPGMEEDCGGGAALLAAKAVAAEGITEGKGMLIDGVTKG